ncbi:50S ribosomal protein L17 [Ruminococcaceae bacterium OttesenSCG-928-D13]|nr:50S ribosomal protein L17 [Ruminococcaceae bacterium OttesenSCG-928-D13]
MPGTRKLGRPSDSRRAMMRAMVTQLFEHGKIETTVTRAKEVRNMAEKMITLGKRDDLHAKRQVFSYVTNESVAKKVIDETAPKYASRSGGYTRITKIGVRKGDAAPMAVLELI